MSARDNGGPAFPVIPPCSADGNTPAGYPFPASGMTLRDWFAGIAMQGRLANDNMLDRFGLAFDDAAKAAYLIADAMLAERAK